MPGSVFVLGDDGKLVSLNEEQYESEDLLQTLLEKYPAIIAGDQINPDVPRRWMLIKREAEVPGDEGLSGRWHLDHLFLDQEGIPTLIEVKRSTDTRIRREVVGQMLDYAANATVYWSIETVRAYFEQTCEKENIQPDEALKNLVGPEANAEAFWQTVKTNLRAGRLRLLFVADSIPQELRRIIEFLNTQMDPAEVLGVEIRKYSGEKLNTLVPRVIGQTAEAGRRRSGAARSSRQWDEPSFFRELEAQHGGKRTNLAREIHKWANKRNLYIKWGTGSSSGSMTLAAGSGFAHTIFTVWTYGKVEVLFEYQTKRPPFDSIDKRRELLNRLNEVPGISLPDDAIDRRPSIPLEAFELNDSLQDFLKVMEWYVEETRRST